MVGKHFLGMFVDVVTNISVVEQDDATGETYESKFAFTSCLKGCDDYFLYFSDEGDYINLAVAIEKIDMLSPATNSESFGELN